MSFWLSVPADRIMMDLSIQMKDEFLAGLVPADRIMMDSSIQMNNEFLAGWYNYVWLIYPQRNGKKT